MKKIYLVFRSLSLIELIIIAFTLISGDSCGSVCDTHSLLNPFGVDASYIPGSDCIKTCVWHPHVFFYITFDIFLLTMIVGIATLIIGKKFITDNSKYLATKK